MPRVAHIAFGFALVLLLAGCSRNAEQQAADSLYWTPPGEPMVLVYRDYYPLFLQLSADPVVYISHISEKREQELTDEEQSDGIIVMPSTLDDILPRIIDFQVAQETAGKMAMVMIGGDDRAPCSSILKAIDCAKRARVEHILFETGAGRPSGRAFMVTTSFPPSCFEFPNGFKPSRELAKSIATITILKNGVIQWGDTPVTLGIFIDELEGFRRKKGVDEVLFVVRVDADAPFSVLRYALEQARRAGIHKVSIVPL